ncbi:MAG: RHS repeat-associated core domain-containing protein [Cyanobacteria bacterium J06649_11]
MQHERDVETGFDYRGARFYDGECGRFLSLDPLAMDYPSLSDYAYVMDNPLIFIDPTGRSSESSYTLFVDGMKVSDNAEIRSSGSRDTSEPEARSAVGLDDYIDAISKARVRSSLQLRDFYSGYKETRGLRGERNRYLYSTNWGWIDMKHFASAAAGAHIFGVNGILEEGELLEKQQLGSKDSGVRASAYSYEDLVSNLLGAAFYEYTKTHKGTPYVAGPQIELYDEVPVLNTFLKEIGVVNNPLEASPIPISQSTAYYRSGLKNRTYYPLSSTITESATNSEADQLVKAVRDNYLKR